MDATEMAEAVDIVEEPTELTEADVQAIEDATPQYQAVTASGLFAINFRLIYATMKALAGGTTIKTELLTTMVQQAAAYAGQFTQIEIQQQLAAQAAAKAAAE